MSYQPHSRTGGLVGDLTRGVRAGQPAMRYGGARALRSAGARHTRDVAVRLFVRERATVSCAHAMAHAGGAA